MFDAMISTFRKSSYMQTNLVGKGWQYRNEDFLPCCFKVLIEVNLNFVNSNLGLKHLKHVSKFINFDY
jgi:hypothetical protein